MDLKQEAQALAPYLSSLRREFHIHPCISREEFWTAERIEKELDAIGITDHQRVDGSGVGVLLGLVDRRGRVAYAEYMGALRVHGRH